VNTPALLIVPTLVLLLLHVTVMPVIALPFWSFGTAVKVVVLPTSTVVVAGETVIVVSTGTADSVVKEMTAPFCDPALLDARTT